MSDDRTTTINYDITQVRNGLDAILDDDDIHEAVNRLLTSADQAFDRLIAIRGIPPVYAANLLAGALNARLLTLLVEPPMRQATP